MFLLLTRHKYLRQTKITWFCWRFYELLKKHIINLQHGRSVREKNPTVCLKERKKCRRFGDCVAKLIFPHAYFLEHLTLQQVKPFVCQYIGSFIHLQQQCVSREKAGRYFFFLTRLLLRLNSFFSPASYCIGITSMGIKDSDKLLYWVTS